MFFAIFFAALLNVYLIYMNIIHHLLHLKLHKEFDKFLSIKILTYENIFYYKY